MVHLAIIWHMHQPCYRDYLTGAHHAPWVRLHCLKDYLDMLLILEEFEGIKQTFNLTPALLEQIEYLSKGEEDYWFIVSKKKAGSLTLSEKDFIINNFFSCHPRHMISIFPRFRDLYSRREIKDFNDQDILDLQVLFNLSWIDPYFRRKDGGLKKIVRKARFFLEEDKGYVLEFHKKIISQIIPAYTRYVKEGRIEITTTPFYHPILPLLHSTDSAKESMAGAPLPKNTFSFPDDAHNQIKLGKEYVEKLVNCKIEGMWPSEQSVSAQTASFFAKEKVNWIVADEGILFKSRKKLKRSASTLYRPYCVPTEQGEINIVFRDRNLSDLIGFHYHKMSHKDAVKDFVYHLSQINDALKKSEGLVVVALDGENAWEYYKRDGFYFLRKLYMEIKNLSFVQCTTVKEYLKKFPAKDKIKRLYTGSWINGDFYKWIGRPCKNYAWDLLTQARKILSSKQLDAQRGTRALRQMYILEGSDWFWWQDDEQEGMFDSLFRLHLKNFYTIIQERAPDILDFPLSKTISDDYAK